LCTRNEEEEAWEALHRIDDHEPMLISLWAYNSVLSDDNVKPEDYYYEFSKLVKLSPLDDHTQHVFDIIHLVWSMAWKEYEWQRVMTMVSEGYWLYHDNHYRLIPLEVVSA
jgi:hypothetical protein